MIGNVSGTRLGAAATGLTVTVVGTTVSVSVDSSGQFTLRNTPTGQVQLRFTGPGLDAVVTIEGVGDHDEIRITIRVSGGAAEIEDHRHESPDHRVEIEGRITDIDLAGRTLRVADAVINVPAGTTIRHGGTPVDFSSLHVGDRVHIKGAATGPTVTASEVNLQNPSGPGKPDDAAGRVELKGAIADLAGACPSISFAISGSPVATNAATQFEGGACNTLKNGDKVEVKGTRQSNGTVLASEVEKEDDDDDDNEHEVGEVELKGALAGLSGTCPSIAFTVSGSSVAANGSTKFEGGACSTLKNGDKVEVEGTRQSNGTVLASEIEKEDGDDDKKPAAGPVELKGALGGLSGTCPSIAFTVSGSSVAANGSTKFEGGACSTLKNGDKVEVEGTRQSNGTVLASQIEKKK
ncbi:MAG: hypothetical protein A3H97_02780 [Acidobacteria bacterium RIFCSPLOWO2_02_FULL_65_29]|nr:MAG: hypothetical protein A3H97_02780 [Acidobacteria bacterium RIFCSPLOWO2_02_FULL_65_29]